MGLDELPAFDSAVKELFGPGPGGPSEGRGHEGREGGRSRRRRKTVQRACGGGKLKSLFFEKEDDAKAMAEGIKAGKSFEELAEKAVADKKPFYLYMSHYAVHAPWEKDDRFYQKYIEEGLKPFEATIASMIEGMDKSLGDLMDEVERLGIARDTVILFMSDNGSPSQCPRKC